MVSRIAALIGLVAWCWPWPHRMRRLDAHEQRPRPTVMTRHH
jgi:hypothetical protein